MANVPPQPDIHRHVFETPGDEVWPRFDSAVLPGTLGNVAQGLLRCGDPLLTVGAIRLLICSRLSLAFQGEAKKLNKGGLDETGR